MSIKYNVGNCKGENPMFCKRFYLHGDGESTEVTINLQNSPVRMEFLGDFPSLAYARDGQGTNCDITSLKIDGSMLTFQFAHPPTTTEYVTVDIEFWYGGGNG